MTTTRRSRPIEVTDAPEHRAIPIERVEMREADENEIVLEGYASTFEEYEMYGGPSNYGWIERIDEGAFDKTLREKPDLHLLINHAGMPLARTKSGTLDLSVDKRGLKVVARMDKRDPEVQALAIKMERGDMDEMSFAFRVKKQEWKAADGFEDIDEQSYRTITEVSLHKGDVSVVNWGANPTTHAEVKSADVLRFLAECDEEELAELRAHDDVLKRLSPNATITIENFNSGIMSVNEVREAEGLDLIEEGDEEIPAALSAVLTELIERMDEVEALLRGEDEEDVTDQQPRGMSLREALAHRGAELEGDAPLSLAEARAFLENL